MLIIDTLCLSNLAILVCKCLFLDCLFYTIGLYVCSYAILLCFAYWSFLSCFRIIKCETTERLLLTMKDPRILGLQRRIIQSRARDKA